MTDQSNPNPNPNPNARKRRRGIVAGATLAALVAGGGLSVAAAAQGSPPDTKAPASQQETGPEAGEAPEATFESSITSPEVPEDENASEADEAAQEKAEVAELEKLATVTPEQATEAATKAVPGKAATPELENEDGNVVYEVEVTSADGKTETEVIVDAGNAKVLAQEVDDDENEADEDCSETPGATGTETPAPTTGATPGN